MRGFLLALLLGARVFSPFRCSLLNFKVMIERVTQKNALIYYNGYGCYCGKGGRGKPRDKTDTCCFNHDCCYERLHHRKCHPFIDHYRYLIVNDDILCNYRNGSACSLLACDCDREAAVCFRNESKSYSRKWRHYPGFLCKEVSPKCPEERPDEGNKSTPHPQDSGGTPTGKHPGMTLQPN